ncbi:hypothetical protein GCM10007160_18870 [Litchfieldella qijiaojingensis]|uniref:Glycosyltransferase n=1 Tax=Litchfieldella qijiaojingensis TaxID=980347 RepID=A0ABQ2YQN4_9GAMM|nr:glycosyltransferase family 1 protein [Halomonas qijiaojingensis]GGX91650.1 hypothetical protein GCM10007160_18870 [Halomonas qijiaojingensis]
MHIADITMFHAPTSGGVRTYLQAKHRHFAQLRDIDASLLIPGSERLSLGSLQTLPAPHLPLGKGYRFPLRRRPWHDALVELQPDVIEAGDPYVTAWAALEAGQMLGVPVVGFYHSDLPRLMGDRFGAFVSRRLQRYVVDLYQRFDSVLAPCLSMAERLQAWGVDDVRVQPLGVDVDMFHPRRRAPELRARLGIRDSQRLLVFAGRNSREKNIEVLFAVARLLGPRYHLLVMGPGMPAAPLDNVTVIDRCCAPNEVARALASADAMIHAGTRETFGLVALEAMASGLPVVAARAGALAENVPLGCGILCEPHSPKAMACTVEELFLNDAAAMGRHARRHVERHFSWQRVIAPLLDHYRDLIGDPSRGGQHQYG